MRRLEPLALKDIQICDPLFGHYVEKLHTEIIPYQWGILNDQGKSEVPSGCLRNFRIAAGLEKGERYGAIFQDSDLAKWLEAVAYSLQTRPDPQLEKRADECVDLLEKAQQADGYLNTYFTLIEPGARWTNLMEGHELYCAGHFIEAAVAYAEATGKKKFLQIMCRYADLIDKVFGPGENQLKGYPGHEEIELALVKLYHATAEKRYLQLAMYFVNQRGTMPLYFEEEVAKRNGKTHYDRELMKDTKYAQTHFPPRKQTTAEGHAVRAAYLYCAMADLAQEYGDEELKSACRQLFQSITREKMYLTGGVGSAAYGERFSGGFDLPNDSCYCETCASIGMALFALRMCRMERDAVYADMMERELYNNVLSGVNRDGNRFFYVNPLEVVPDSCEQSTSRAHVKTVRQEWFDVACCPTNIARTLGSLGQYLFGVAEGEMFVYLYLPCTTSLSSDEKLTVETRYPSDGAVRLKRIGTEPRTLWLRIPGHSPLLSLRVNGEAITPKIQKGFAEVPCAAGNTEIELVLDVKPRFVFADVRVTADAGMAALMQGPLVYCFEEADNGASLAAMGVDMAAAPKACENPVDPASNALSVSGWQEKNAEDRLYPEHPPARETRALKAVPYYCWNNRGRGEMRVWMRYR